MVVLYFESEVINISEQITFCTEASLSYLMITLLLADKHYVSILHWICSCYCEVAVCLHFLY